MNWIYLPVAFGLNWFSAIVFILLPLLAVVSVFCRKRRFLWTAPLVSILLAVLFTAIVEPGMLGVTEYRAMFCGIILPIQAAVSAGLTALAYAAAYMLKRRKQTI